MFKLKKFKLRKEKNEELKLKKVEPEELEIPICSQCHLVKPLVENCDFCEDCKPHGGTDVGGIEQKEEPKSKEETTAEYKELQKEYNTNPSEELRERLVTVHGKLLSLERIPEEHDTTGESEQHATGESVQQNEDSPEAETPATIKNKIENKIDTVEEPNVIPAILPTAEQVWINNEIKKEAEASVSLDHDELTTQSEDITSKIAKEITSSMKQPMEQIASPYSMIKIPDTIPSGANLSEVELKKLESVANETKSNPVGKEEEYKKYMIQEEKEQNIQIYIRDQKAKQPQIQQQRKNWREQLPLLREEALRSFVKMFNDEEYANHYTETIQKEFETEEKEVKESIKKAETLYDSDVPVKEVTIKPDAKVVINDLKLTKEKEDAEKVANDELLAEEVVVDLTTDLIPPDDLDDTLKKVWKVLPRDTQLDLIDKHKVQVVEIIKEKKKKFFGKKIDFSILKKKKKKEIDTKQKISFFDRHIRKKNELSDTDAYCNICKHHVVAHQQKGRSTGCRHCGCLLTVQKILEVNKVTLELELEEKEIVEIKDTGKICKCGHREVVHKERGFCEEKDCYCIVFENTTESKSI